MQTPEGRKKARDTLIAKYGSEEAYLAKKREWAAKGGSAKVPKGYSFKPGTAGNATRRQSE